MRGIYLQIRHGMTPIDLFSRTSPIHRQVRNLFLVWLACSAIMLIGLTTYPG